MQIRIVDNVQDFRKLEPAWNALTEQERFSVPFFTWYWHYKWWEYFGKDQKLFILAVTTADGNIAGIAPLMKRKTYLKGLPAKELCFLDNGIGSRNAIIFSGSKRKFVVHNEICRFLSSIHPKWDFLNLQNIEEHSTCIKEVIIGEDKLGLKYIKTPGLHSPFIEIEGDFQDYFNNTFKRKQRYNIRRNATGHTKAGKIKVESFDSPDNIMRGLDFAFQVSRESWK
jgi:hypothetical protein